MQYDYKNTMLNPKIHCKSYNYSNNNYIPELLMVNSCWNGVNKLANHKCGTYISYVALTVWVFDVRWLAKCYIKLCITPQNSHIKCII